MSAYGRELKRGAAQKNVYLKDEATWVLHGFASSPIGRESVILEVRWSEVEQQGSILNFSLL